MTRALLICNDAILSLAAKISCTTGTLPLNVCLFFIHFLDRLLFMAFYFLSNKSRSVHCGFLSSRTHRDIMRPEFKQTINLREHCDFHRNRSGYFHEIRNSNFSVRGEISRINIFPMRKRFSTLVKEFFAERYSLKCIVLLNLNRTYSSDIFMNL